MSRVDAKQAQLTAITWVSNPRDRTEQIKDIGRLNELPMKAKPPTPVPMSTAQSSLGDALITCAAEGSTVRIHARAWEPVAAARGISGPFAGQVADRDAARIAWCRWKLPTWLANLGTRCEARDVEVPASGQLIVEASRTAS